MAHSVHGTKDFAVPGSRGYKKLGDIPLDTNPELTAVCLNCEKKDCSGSCQELMMARDALSRRQGKGRKGYGFAYKDYIYKGRAWTALELAKAEDLVYSRFWKLLRQGVSVEEAVEVSRKRKSISELARQRGLESATVRMRMRKGATMEEALNAPVRKPKSQKSPGREPKVYEYRGEMLSARQLAERSGVSRTTLEYRLRAGWPIEEAMETPGRKRKKEEKDNAQGNVEKDPLRGAHEDRRTQDQHGNLCRADGQAD